MKNRILFKLGKSQFISTIRLGAFFATLSLLQATNALAWGASKYLYFAVTENNADKFYSLNMDSLYPTIFKGNRGDLECSYKDKGGNVQMFKFATDPCGPITSLSIELSKGTKEEKIEASSTQLYSDHKSIFLSGMIGSSSGEDHFGLTVMSASQFKNLRKHSEALPSLAKVPEITISPMTAALSEQTLQCKMPMIQYNCGH
jgi:hypothetical protein